MFLVRLPSAPLRPFIDAYWFFVPGARGASSWDELVFPDGRADLVFTFGKPIIRERSGFQGEVRPIRAPYLDAQRRYPVRIRRAADGDLIWVRFRFGGLAALSGAPAHELSGHTIDLTDLLGPEGGALEEQLAAYAGRPAAQSALLDAFFLSRLTVPPGFRHVTHLIRLIERRRGVISVSELSLVAGESVRTVDRLFQRVVGLPPKFLARTVRFRHVHRVLSARPQVRWMDLVAALDYCDESHLAKEIVSLTGLVPRDYRGLLVRKERACLDALSSFYMTRGERPA